MPLFLAIAASLFTIAAPAQAQQNPPAKFTARDQGRAERAAKKLIRRYGALKDDAKRAAVLEELRAIDLRGRFPALVYELKHSTRKDSRILCVNELEGFKNRDLVPHLVICATSKTDREAQDAAHASAQKLDADYARRWYELYVARDLGNRRSRSLERLGLLRQPESVPLLAGVVAHVGLEVSVQQAKLLGFDTVTINANSGNTQMPIQLPSVSLLDMKTTAVVSVKLQNTWRTLALNSLRSIVGEDLGEEPEPYLAWYEEHKKTAEAGKKANAEKAPAPTR
jgi:hypothetical protein